jgi:hypothetical protein
MSDLAIYDLDRTITRRPTYTLFLIHCALRRQQWRLLLLPLVVFAMLSYLIGLFDRAKLKEICQALLIGRRIHAAQFKPLAESFADATVARNIRPGARTPTGSGDGVLPTLRRRDRQPPGPRRRDSHRLGDWPRRAGPLADPRHQLLRGPEDADDRRMGR